MATSTSAQRLATHAAPVGLERGVALDECLKPEPERGVSGLPLAKEVNRAVELLAGDLGLDALDPLKPLLVQMLDARELYLGV